MTNIWQQGRPRRSGNGRGSKYKNRRFSTKDGWFDSKGEWARFQFLKDEEKRGRIKDLERQVRFALDVNGSHICDYIADFTYKVVDKNSLIVEDFKGWFIADVFRLKSKLMKALLEIEVRIVKSPTEDPCKVDDPVKQ